MSEATKAIVLNAVPLLVLAAADAAVAAAVLPVLWRDRRRAHPLDWAIVLCFPGGAAAAAIFGVLVAAERQPLAGHVWISLAAILVALAPALFLLAQWRDRALALGGIGRTQEAEDRASVRDRDVEAVAEISNALVRASSAAAIAQPLVRQVVDILGVGFAGVVIVSDDGRLGEGVYGELDGREVDWWREVRIDLRNEPSGIASAVFDAAPVTVYDIASSPLVSPRLVKRVGARSGVWIPLRAQERVIGVLAIASTDAKRAFSSDEVNVLQAVAAEAALALERVRSASALSDALGREQAVATITRRIRRELDVDGVVGVAREELQQALHLDRVEIVLGSASDGGTPIVAHDERIGTLIVERAEPLGAGERFLVDTVANEIGASLQTAGLLADSERQTRIQRGFYRIAALLGEPLSLAETYDATAHAAAEALGGDFAAVLVKSGHELQFVGGHALPDTVRALELPRALLEAADEGLMLASASVADDERFDTSWRSAPFTSLLAIPVPGQGAEIVVVLFGESRDFAPDDLELALQVAGAARGALDRSRLYEAERTARSLSQQLARTGSLLATELDPVAVLEAVVVEAVALLGVDAAALAALEGDELVVMAAVGEGAGEAVGARSASTGCVAGDVVQSRVPVAYTDTAADESLAESDALLAAGHRAYLGVPLTVRDGSLHGVLSVYARAPRAWHEEEIQALATLAASAAVALSNAELYQQVAVEREQSVAILANVADGIVAVDRDGHVVLWNRAAEEITGVPAAEAIGRAMAQVLQRDLASEAGGTNRSIAIPRAGVDVWLSLSEAAMRDPAGAVAGRIFAFRDISSEHVVEQMKSDFVSTVSVELRTPLTSIYGFAQTLLREDVVFGESERRTFLEFIARESERLTAIVDALLNVARLDTGDLTVSLEPTDVGRVVDRALAAAAADADGYRLVAEVNGSIAAHADPDKLRQVLDQLVSNAVKYSPPGGTVVVTARRIGETVEVAIVDDGAGVPAAERERIFSKFYKAGDAQGRGTGLGLFIAQGLVHEMGGRIWVDADVEKGSRFAFVLPLAEDG